MIRKTLIMCGGWVNAEEAEVEKTVVERADISRISSTTRIASGNSCEEAKAESQRGTFHHVSSFTTSDNETPRVGASAGWSLLRQ